MRLAVAVSLGVLAFVGLGVGVYYTYVGQAMAGMAITHCVWAADSSSNMCSVAIVGIAAAQMYQAWAFGAAVVLGAASGVVAWWRPRRDAGAATDALSQA